MQSTGYRTTPDVAFVADPNTGAWIADPYNLPADNPWQVVGGTSLSAPSWAGLIALVDEGRTTAGSSAFSSDGGTTIQAALYSAPAGGFNTIATGTNGAYTAAAGYNLVTGLGTPIAGQLVPALIGYNGTAQLNATASAGQGNGDGGSGSTNVMPVFNVFDAVTPSRFSAGARAAPRVLVPKSALIGLPTAAAIAAMLPSAPAPTVGPGNAYVLDAARLPTANRAAPATLWENDLDVAAFRAAFHAAFAEASAPDDLTNDTEKIWTRSLTLQTTDN